MADRERVWPQTLENHLIPVQNDGMKKQKFPASSKPGIKRSPPKEDVQAKKSDDSDMPDDEESGDDTGDDGESEDDEEQEDGDHEGDEEPSDEQEEVEEDKLIAIMHQVLGKLEEIQQNHHAMNGGGMPPMMPHPGMGGPPPMGPPGMGGAPGGAPPPGAMDMLVQKAMGR